VQLPPVLQPNLYTDDRNNSGGIVIILRDGRLALDPQQAPKFLFSLPRHQTGSEDHLTIYPLGKITGGLFP
jgi:hypothetical protein